MYISSHATLRTTPRPVAWVREAALSKLDLGIHASVVGLDFLSKYFEVPYPLSKLDMICPPEMSPNAMENWGLITYRYHSLHSYQACTYACSCCSAVCCNIEPEWGALDQFVVKKQQSVMALDALKSSHPVSVPVPDPAIINEIFDTITYNKGASVIRMMSKFLTERVFREGLRNYLTTL
ncbi:Aminopeptidase N [Portunus trituberculatus]|uniref:Aminopeptidase N n=1 Tax=Portunus trituberculatus TaxID=210409 RepID=A0A5B7FH07_PORTR|nr:Aminopeptidase N [Portunus trituberculatus]